MPGPGGQELSGGEITGTETTRLVWLEDNGRHAVLEYAFGTASVTPTPPVDLFSGTPLLPGVIIDLHRAGRKR